MEPKDSCSTSTLQCTNVLHSDLELPKDALEHWAEPLGGDRVKDCAHVRVARDPLNAVDGVQITLSPFLVKSQERGRFEGKQGKGDMSASAKAISVSPTREYGRRAKSLCTKRKSTSVDRYFRPCGATMDITPPDIRISDRFCTGEFSAFTFTKRQRECRSGYWVCSSSGNCCRNNSVFL